MAESDVATDLAATAAVAEEGAMQGRAAAPPPPQQPPHPPSARRCKFFANPRGCRKGAACRFLHAESDAPPAPVAAAPAAKPCKFFASPSGCRNGAACRFLHAAPAADDGRSEAPRAAAPKLLVVDALNYLSTFLKVRERECSFADGDFDRERPFEGILAMRDRVARFVQAARDLGYRRVLAVIDAGTRTEEAKAKWKARREEEIASGSRGVPLYADYALADAFAHAPGGGADVILPEGEDADDVVMKLADEHGGADVLSGDRDCFRYISAHGATLWNRIFATFTIDDHGLRLWRGPNLTPKPGVERRTLADIAWRAPEEWSPDAEAPFVSRVEALKLMHDRSSGELLYERGTTDSVNKLHGNLHAVTAPLRRALWAARGIDAVRERYPVWDKDADRAAWHDALATPDATHAESLASVTACLRAIEALDPAPRDDAERAFARAALAAAYAVDAHQSRASIGTFSATLAEALGRAPLPPPDPARAAARINCDGKMITCRSCKATVYIPKHIVAFHTANGWDLPRVCGVCKRSKSEGAGGGRGRGGHPGSSTVGAAMVRFDVNQ